MNELIETCEIILSMLDSEFPNQREYDGIVNNTYTIVSNIYDLVSNNEIYEEKIELNSLVRRFVDETTHFSSPIITELENLNKLLS